METVKPWIAISGVSVFLFKYLTLYILLLGVHNCLFIYVLCLPWFLTILLFFFKLFFIKFFIFLIESGSLNILFRFVLYGMQLAVFL